MQKNSPPAQQVSVDLPPPAEDLPLGNAPEQDGETLAQIRQERLTKLLEIQEKKGISQSEVAQRAKCQPQYLNDVKSGRRPLSERFARRLQDEFHVDYRWLLGLQGSMDLPRPQGALAPVTASRLWLPVFSDPIAGDPATIPAWDGSSVEIAGVAAVRVLQAQHPYALRFGATDRRQRICRGDLLLVSQAVNDQANIHVIQARGKSYLARRLKHGAWECLNPDNTLRGEPTVIGHVLGILWGAL